MRAPLWIAMGMALICGTAMAMEVNVLSFNVRWASPADGENVWKNRKSLAADVIEASDAKIVGVQEALAGQLADLKTALPGFESIGVGRDDGRNAGEFCAILYDTVTFESEKSGTFWLSKTPDTPGSMSWETACTRIATWAVFRAKADGTRVFVLNTHLDHQSAQAREEGAKLIAEKVRELAGDLPVIVTGDFNAIRNSRPIETLVTGSPPLHHARETTGGPARSTFNGFKNSGDGAEIDHILTSPGIEVLEFDVIEQRQGGVFVSDHWPIRARLRVP